LPIKLGDAWLTLKAKSADAELGVTVGAGLVPPPPDPPWSANAGVMPRLMMAMSTKAIEAAMAGRERRIRREFGNVTVGLTNPFAGAVSFSREFSSYVGKRN
jgi:hypothetical protein